MATDQRLREATAALTAEAAVDLATVTEPAETSSQARALLVPVLAEIIATYGFTLSAAAADWYDDLRGALSIPGMFTASPVEIRDTGWRELLDWAEREATELPAFKSLVAEGTQRRIANHPRETVTRNSVEDPQARGWQRIGVGACDFCAMLIGRGAVYSSATARFAAHDGCNCGAHPAFTAVPLPVTPFTPSARGSDRDRERTRAWMRNNF